MLLLNRSAPAVPHTAQIRRHASQRYVAFSSMESILRCLPSGICNGAVQSRASQSGFRHCLQVGQVLLVQGGTIQSLHSSCTPSARCAFKSLAEKQEASRRPHILHSSRRHARQRKAAFSSTVWTAAPAPRGTCKGALQSAALQSGLRQCLHLGHVGLLHAGVWQSLHTSGSPRV